MLPRLCRCPRLHPPRPIEGPPVKLWKFPSSPLFHSTLTQLIYGEAAKCPPPSPNVRIVAVTPHCHTALAGVVAGLASSGNLGGSCLAVAATLLRGMQDTRSRQFAHSYGVSSACRSVLADTILVPARKTGVRDSGTRNFLAPCVVVGKCDNISQRVACLSTWIDVPMALYLRP